jgi:hypothetical protein
MKFQANPNSLAKSEISGEISNLKPSLFCRQSGNALLRVCDYATHTYHCMCITKQKLYATRITVCVSQNKNFFIEIEISGKSEI